MSSSSVYDPALGQFLSPDTLVPDAGVVLDYNRYMYVRGNPVKYTDPSGHYTNDEIMQHFGCSDWACVENLFASHTGTDYSGLRGWLVILREAQDGFEVGAWNPLKQAWAKGTFQRTESGSINIIYNGNSISEKVFAQTGGKYPATEQYMFGQYGRYSLSWVDTNLRRTERASYDSSGSECLFTDCTGSALNGISTISSVVAAGCAAFGLVPCTGTATLISTASGATAAVRATAKALGPDATAVDVIDATISASTTVAGYHGHPYLGPFLSAGQWIYDEYISPAMR